MQKTRLSATDTAKLVRKALKESFTAKFSVRTKSGAVTVGWTDGPTEAQVKAVADRFQGATFDGMRDLKEYIERTLDGQPVSLGIDFIFYERAYSLDFMKRYGVERVLKKYGSDWVLSDNRRIAIKDVPLEVGYSREARIDETKFMALYGVESYAISYSANARDSFGLLVYKSAAKYAAPNAIAQYSETANRVA